MKIGLVKWTALRGASGLLIAAALLGCLGMRCTAPVVSPPPPTVERAPRMIYDVDLTSREAHQCRVTLHLPDLPVGEYLFRFASIGNYAAANFGTFIQSLTVLDSMGNAQAARQMGTDVWRILIPPGGGRIEYRMADTWHHATRENSVPEMLGTAVARDFAFISGQGLFGFIQGLEEAPVQLRFHYPSEWRLASALQRLPDGSLMARNFSELASAPTLLGYLSTASDRIIGSDVSISVYSRNDRIQAETMLTFVNEVITATNDFFGEVPIDRYSMLFVFDRPTAGGVEYFNNAAFVVAEELFFSDRQYVRDVIAHEFFHLIIPFSIRSDALNVENFFQQRPTGHLWFFEGVTEWASDMLQVRGGLKSLEDYIRKDLRDKLFREDFFRSDISLHRMSLNRQRSESDYLSVYSRGALAAALLDIHLLDVTYGRRGLQDVLRDLYLDFGPDDPLPEDRFFEVLRDYCGPELRPFIDRYIIGNEELPVAEMMEKVGIHYERQRVAEEGRSDAGMMVTPGEGGVRVLWVDAELDGSDIRSGDLLTHFNGIIVTPANYQKALHEQAARLDIGERYRVGIVRNGRPLEREGRIVPLKYRHIFSSPRMISPRQHQIRKAWSTNR